MVPFAGMPGAISLQNVYMMQRGPTVIFQVSPKSTQVWGSYNRETFPRPPKVNLMYIFEPIVNNFNISYYHLHNHVSYLLVYQTEHLWTADRDVKQNYNTDNAVVCRCIHECNFHSNDDHMLSCVYVVVGPCTLDMLDDPQETSSVNSQVLITNSHHTMHVLQTYKNWNSL